MFRAIISNIWMKAGKSDLIVIFTFGSNYILEPRAMRIFNKERKPNVILSLQQTCINQR